MNHEESIPSPISGERKHVKRILAELVATKRLSEYDMRDLATELGIAFYSSESQQAQLMLREAAGCIGHERAHSLSAYSPKISTVITFVSYLLSSWSNAQAADVQGRSWRYIKGSSGARNLLMFLYLVADRPEQMQPDLRERLKIADAVGEADPVNSAYQELVEHGLASLVDGGEMVLTPAGFAMAVRYKSELPAQAAPADSLLERAVEESGSLLAELLGESDERASQ